MTDPANEVTASTGRSRDHISDPAMVVARPKTEPLDQHLATIRTLGGLLDDLEVVRIMNGNRIAALEREYGESLPHLDVIQRQLHAIEHLSELELIRAWRKHPLAPWAKAYRGIGEKSIARLVAIIGDPAERPNVAKLWAYCGHGDPARSVKRKGMTQEELFKKGSPRAKKQVWLIATSLLKAGNRDVYDAARVNVAERVHDKPCVRCGPSGHPAAPGTPWSDGHKHAHALRVTGKAFLKDLWIASRQGPIRDPKMRRGSTNDNAPTASPSKSAAGALTSALREQADA